MSKRLVIGASITFLLAAIFWWNFSTNGTNAQTSISTVTTVTAQTPSSTIQNASQAINRREVLPFAADLLPSDSKQLVLVQATGDQQVGILSAWNLSGDEWTPVFSNIKVVLGAKGMISPEEKKEGDKSTPAGTYRLTRAFGYKPFAASKLNYIQLTENHYWVDDPSSITYNQMVDKKPKANSYEIMKRSDDLYKWGIVVEYNTKPVVSGKGSAIFIHVWRGPEQATAGCVAMAENDIIRLLDWLDLQHSPVILLQRTTTNASPPR